MQIVSIELNNFVSYRGLNTLDFETKSGNLGYAFFGAEGRGKTSILNAAKWCLYQEVTASRLIDNTKLVVKKRPVIDGNQVQGEFAQRFPAPLHCATAYLKGDYNMHVKIEFLHENNGKISRYVLKREAKPIPSKPKPANDSHLSIKAHLSIDGSTVSTTEIPQEINKIIPSNVAKFFFIEVDKIERYADLLSGGVSQINIKEDIDAILGVPALERSQELFDRLQTSAKRIVDRKKKAATNDPVLLRNIDDLEEEINRYEEDEQKISERMDELVGLIEDLKIKIEDEGNAERLIQDQKDQEKIISESNDEIKSAYEYRNKVINNQLWMSLIQSPLRDALKIQTGKKKRYDELVTKKVKLESQLNHYETLLKEDSAVCEHCGKDTQISTEKERKEASEFVSVNQPLLEGYKEELANTENPEQSIFALKEFNALIDHEAVGRYDTKIGKERVKINGANRRLNSIEKALENHDVVQIAKWQGQITSATKELGSKEDLLKVIRSDLANAGNELIKLNNKLSTPKDSKDLKIAEYKHDVYKWMSEAFDRELEKYREETRLAVEERSTDAFAQIFPGSERYQGIRISKDWEVELIMKNGSAKFVQNPGHKQTIAVSLFDGLRHTSSYRFPTFFDNPGSKIREETRNNMVEYFWGIEENQTIMLSHSGGLKEEETIQSYGEKLARAWRLNYEDGDDITRVEVILG